LTTSCVAIIFLLSFREYNYVKILSVRDVYKVIWN